MNELFFTATPVVGREYIVEEWNVDGRNEVEKTPLLTIAVTQVEYREESEWNPVHKLRVPQTNCYVSFTADGGLYTRRVIVNTYLSESAPSQVPEQQP